MPPSDQAPKILIIDDEEEFAEVLADHLRDRFNLSVDYDARDALDRLEKESFSLIISDYLMPVMDGKAFLKELRQRDNFTPICFVSGFFDLRTVKDLVNMGASCLFTKPINFRDFQANVAGMLLGSTEEEEEETVPSESEPEPLIEERNQAQNLDEFLPLLRATTDPSSETASLIRNLGMAWDWQFSPGSTLHKAEVGLLTNEDLHLPTLAEYLSFQRDDQLATLWHLAGGDPTQMESVQNLPAEAWTAFAQKQGWANR